MASNLDFGAQLPSIQFARDNCIAEKYCFGDNPSICNARGGLYSWDEMMQYEDSEGTQGFCPPEWHIPAEAE